MKTLRHWLITRRRKALLAFNLIEVTLSVAIIGVAVAVLLGMFPVGLKAGRDATNYTMASSLANSILSTLQASGGAGTFSAIRLSEFGTVSGATTFTVFYQQTGGTLQGARGTIFNAANPSLTMFGTQQPFIIFFDAQGRLTSNTGTGTGVVMGTLGNTPSLTRLPYYRVEFTITNNSSLVPGSNVATVLMNIRWPTVQNLGTRNGWRPRRDSPTGPVTSSDVFTDKTATYFGIIIQNNK